jgi:L,D-transpeptidase catalytic domain
VRRQKTLLTRACRVAVVALSACLLVIAPVSGTQGAAKTAAKTTGKPVTKKTVTPAKSVAKSPKTSKAPPKVVLPKAPGSKSINEKPAKVENWSVANTLEGWDRVTEGDWPVSGEAVAVVAKDSSLVVRRKASIGEPGLRFATGTTVTGKVTLLVSRRYLDWIEVLLPVRPNGTIGWVKTDEVTQYTVEFRVLIDKSTNQMIVEKNGKEISRAPVATGTGNTPTPSGLFFVREVVKTDPIGPYGPWVLGLSGYSEVLNTFGNGEGAIGIHGTDQPNLIGTNASFGCVRVTNDVMAKLVTTLPIGTPVEITNSLSVLPTQRRSYGTPDLVFPDPVPEAAPTEPTDEGVSILDAPEYNAAGIDFYEPPA